MRERRAFDLDRRMPNGELPLEQLDFLGGEDPAPANLVVPDYKFTSPTTVEIG